MKNLENLGIIKSAPMSIFQVFRIFTTHTAHHPLLDVRWNMHWSLQYFVYTFLWFFFSFLTIYACFCICIYIYSNCSCIYYYLPFISFINITISKKYHQFAVFFHYLQSVSIEVTHFVHSIFFSFFFCTNKNEMKHLFIFS